MGTYYEAIEYLSEVEGFQYSCLLSASFMYLYTKVTQMYLISYSTETQDGNSYISAFLDWKRILNCDRSKACWVQIIFLYA